MRLPCVGVLRQHHTLTKIEYKKKEYDPPNIAMYEKMKWGDVLEHTHYKALRDKKEETETKRVMFLKQWDNAMGNKKM